MLKRRSKQHPDTTLTKGPGNAGKAMGITKLHSGLNLLGNTIFIIEDNNEYDLPCKIIANSKRIGVESAGPDSLLPYRFYIRGNKYVSGSPVIQAFTFCFQNLSTISPLQQYY
jgi:DNA-3-methyladenine glycosylase